METVSCACCGDPIPLNKPSRPVIWHTKVKRRTRLMRGYACLRCGPHGHIEYDNGRREWYRSVGYALALEDSPAPCEHCGRVVVLAQDKRRRRTVCSPRCAIAITPSHAKDDTPRACSQCGVPLAGRADSDTCSPRCRQRAYRARQRATA